MAARIVDAAFALVYLRLLGRPEVGEYTFLVVFTTYLDTLIEYVRAEYRRKREAS